MKATTLAMDGLQTDPGPFSGASDSALVEAQNVVFERRGLIEPRPSLTMVPDSAIPFAAIYQGRSVGSTNFVWASAAFVWTMRRAGTTTITGPDAFTVGRLRNDYVKGRLLFTSDQGVCEMPVSSGTVAYRAGLPAPSMPWGFVANGGTSGVWLGINQCVAYRFVLARRRVDGALMLSAPTAPFILRNTSVAAGGVTLIPLPGLTYTPYDVNSTFDTLVAGDELHVYRGPVLAAATGIPSDMMRLRAVLPITAGVVQDFTDKLADADWSGPALYTNSNQQGIGQANARPGYAIDICTYNGMTLYLGAKSPMRVTVVCKAIGDISADPSQAICSASVTGSITLGSPNITGLSAADAAYFAVGQVITTGHALGGLPGSADAKFPANTTIVSVNAGAGTAVASANALSTAAAGGITVWDWISVTDGVSSFKIYAQPAASTAILDRLFRQAHGSTGVYYGGYADLEYKWNNAATRVKDVLLHAVGEDNANGQPEFRNVLMTFERASQSSTAFTIKSTKPNAFDRVLDTVTGIASTQDGGDTRIAISKNDIPDAVPVGNYIDVGDLSSAIVRGIPARQSVLVFKADGVYQLFGNSPDSLTIELLDGTIVPVPGAQAGSWITQLGDVVYMMSSRGPMAVTDAGAQPFGMAIMETFRETFGPSFTATQFLSVGTLSAGAAFGSPHVLFSRGSATYVYNVQTDAWSTWTFRHDVSAMWSGPIGVQMIGIDGRTCTCVSDRRLLGSPVTVSSVPTGDTLNATATISTVVANGGNSYAITLSGVTDWFPTVGDLMIRGAVLCVVEAVTGSYTQFTVSAPAAPTTGTVTWVEGFPVRVIWTARTLGDVAVEKRNVEVSFAFALRTFLLRLAGYFKSSYALTTGVQELEEPEILAGWNGAPLEDVQASIQFAPQIVTCGVPQDVALDWGLRVGFTLQQAGSWFSLGAATLTALSSGDRMGRRSR